MSHKVKLEPLLDWITSNTFDKGHGLLGSPEFVVNAVGLLDHLTSQVKISRDEMHKLFDEARVRVHGPDIDLS